MPSFLRRKNILLAAYVASLFVFASYLLAQNPPAPASTPDASPAVTPALNSIEFYGVVQSANRVAMLINGQLIDVSTAQINTDLSPGILVRVQAAWLDDGTLAATRIDPAPDSVPPGIIAVTGVIQNVDTQTNTLQLQNQTFSLTNAIVDNTISAGDPVTVFAIGITPGEWSALAVIDLGEGSTIGSALPQPVATLDPTGSSSSSGVIAPVTTPDVNAAAPIATQEVGEDFEFVGSIEQVGAGFIVVNGLFVNTAQARIDDALTVGLIVRVEARLIGDQLFAERIRAESGGSGGSDDSGGDDNSGRGSDDSGDDNSGGGGDDSGDDDNSGRGGGGDDDSGGDD